MEYTFHILISMHIQLLQFKPTNAHNFIKITLILYNTNSNIFLALLACHEGAHSCINSCLTLLLPTCTRMMEIPITVVYMSCYTLLLFLIYTTFLCYS